MRRIDKFLNLDELDEDCVEEDPTMTGIKTQTSTHILCADLAPLVPRTVQY